MSVRQFFSISAFGKALCALTILAQTPITLRDTHQRGEDLFLGKLPLQGKPRNHVDYFPSPVVRCDNCHGEGKLQLSSSLLTKTRQRRYGPPSVYDQTKFCKLLRTGIDPAYILIDHSMPIYDMPDSDCVALWTYLTHKDSPNAQP